MELHGAPRASAFSGALWARPACAQCLNAVPMHTSKGLLANTLHGQRETAPHVRTGTASEGDAGQAGKGNSGDGVRYIYLNFEQLPGLNLATAPALFRYLSSA